MPASPYTLESPETIREGEIRLYNNQWPQLSTISTGGLEIYVNGSTQTAGFVSGSSATVGNVQTLPLITIPAGTGGLDVMIEMSVAVGSAKYTKGHKLMVIKPGQG